MATNPRIDDLRKRIEKDPGSRLFAQLAEELRKDGELEEAIRVAREGLKSHSSYPSARMTLGRALLDTGDWAAARAEFELVLKGAPDNILASRYLAECLENVGDRSGAITQYKATLAMAPGEKHVLARLQELEGGPARAPLPTKAPGAIPGAPAAAGPGTRPVSALRPPSAGVAAPPPPPPLRSVPAAVPEPPPPPVAAPLPPIPLSSVDGEMELETGRSVPEMRTPAPAAGAAPPMAPIPLVDADEEFELERPYESPTTGIGLRPAASVPVPVAPARAPAAAPAPLAGPESADDEFELEAPHEAPSTSWAAPMIRPLPVIEEAFRPVSLPAAPPAAPPPPPAAASALISPTLGELYFNQGFTEKAVEVYRDLAMREPGNARLSARLRELEKLQGALSGAGAPAVASTSPATAGTSQAADNPSAGRREAIERTIVRLEELLSAIRKG